MSILVLNRPGVISTFMLRPSGHWMSSQYFNCKQIASFIPAINCCPVTRFGRFENLAPHCINPCSILVGAGSKHIILTIWGSAQDQHSPQGAMTLQNNAWFLAEGHSHSPKDYKYKDTLLVPWVLCEGVPLCSVSMILFREWKILRMPTIGTKIPSQNVSLQAMCQPQ